MRWIDRQDDLERAVASMARREEIGVDTEADSLHSYFDKVCLIQVSLADEDLVIDPLARVDLASFGRVLDDPAVLKVFHGGDYDLRIMNRDFAFTVRNLVDTSVCAQLLGYEAIGLAALLERHFGVKLNKVHQRADWSMRPLTPDMLAYAATDTHYLVSLAAKLRAELEALGRWEWAAEEFVRMEAIRFREVPEDVEAWRKMKNLSALDRRSLAVVRAVFAWRDALARKADRPTFKVLSNESIVEIARTRPESLRDLQNLKSVSRYHAERFGRDLLRLVREAMQIPEEELPERNEAKPWIRDKSLESRTEKLKKARDRIARELKIDGSVLAPRHVLTAVAAGGTLDVPAMREWQKRVVGPALLEALGR